MVLRVDSPGGEVFASEQIRREIVALKKAGKPVAVSMGDLAASGGYWISMNADRIYADASTITGSIGIFGLIPTIPRALDKIGVHSDGVGTTRFAGAFDITRPLQPEVGQVIQSVIDKGYRDFTGRVAAARKQAGGAGRRRSPAVACGAARRRRSAGWWTKWAACSRRSTFVAKRAKLGKAGEYQVRYIEKTATPFERFFTGFVGSRIGGAWLRESDIAQRLLAKASPQAAADLRFLEGAITPTRGVPVKALAHCFCGF